MLCRDRFFRGFVCRILQHGIQVYFLLDLALHYSHHASHCYMWAKLPIREKTSGLGLTIWAPEIFWYTYTQLPASEKRGKKTQKPSFWHMLCVFLSSYVNMIRLCYFPSGYSTFHFVSMTLCAIEVIYLPSWNKELFITLNKALILIIFIIIRFWNWLEYLNYVKWKDLYRQVEISSRHGKISSKD